MVVICYLCSSIFEKNIQSLFHSKPLIFLSSVASTLAVLKEQYESWPGFFNSESSVETYSLPQVTINYDLKCGARCIDSSLRINKGLPDEWDHSSITYERKKKKEILGFASSVCLTSKIKIFRISVNATKMRINVKICWALKWTETQPLEKLSLVQLLFRKNLIPFIGITIRINYHTFIEGLQNRYISYFICFMKCII